MPLGVGDAARIVTNYGPVVPSDTIMLVNEAAGVWVGGAGTVVFIKRDGTKVPFAGVQAGTFMHVACIGIGASSTATLMNWLS